jgi:formylglycine-generating enzyme required for sulfatase activity
MVRATACRSVLLTVSLLLVCTALGSAQSGKRRPPDPRGLGVVPATPTTSAPERRVALVIGNGQYQHVPRLANPANDARLIAETLTSVGFALIGGTAQLDLDKPAFDRVVQEFGTVIQGAGVALFYYAGHGVQVRGSNYLVPVSANPTREADIDFQLLNTDLVLRQMEGAGTRLNLLILDACRNNPFAGRGLRTAGGGLAQMQAPEGTLISYATQPGNVAQDGTDGHSPYTAALARAFRKPGLDLFAVFNETGLDVKRRTGGAQQPWVSSSPIAGQFYFTGAPDQPSTGSRDDAVEIAFWNSVKDDRTPDGFQTYLESYPQGKFAALARLKLKQLAETLKPAPSASTPSPATGTQVAVGIYPQQPQTPVGNDGAEMVLVPAGEFMMGSDKDEIDRLLQGRTDVNREFFNREIPRHRVYLDAFYIDKYEVTNARFQQFVQATGHRTTAEREGSGYVDNGEKFELVNGANWRAPRGPGSSIAGLEQHPVVQVSQEDAKAYCAWAGKRLPTEAEWEKAARGTDGRSYPWGSQFDGRRANFCDANCQFNWKDSAANDGYRYTAPVGSYEGGKSPYGAYDMAGNVWEWVADWFDENYYRNSPARNPQGPASGDRAVLRGGGWDTLALNVRAPPRHRNAPAPRDANLGFRCAKTL